MDGGSGVESAARCGDGDAGRPDAPRGEGRAPQPGRGEDARAGALSARGHGEPAAPKADEAIDDGDAEPDDPAAIAESAAPPDVAVGCNGERERGAAAGEVAWDEAGVERPWLSRGWALRAAPLAPSSGAAFPRPCSNAFSIEAVARDDACGRPVKAAQSAAGELVGAGGVGAPEEAPEVRGARVAALAGVAGAAAAAAILPASRAEPDELVRESA